MLSPLLSSITRLWRQDRHRFPISVGLCSFSIPASFYSRLVCPLPVQVLFLRFLTAHPLIHPFKDCSRWLFPEEFHYLLIPFHDVLLFPAKLPAPGELRCHTAPFLAGGRKLHLMQQVLQTPVLKGYRFTSCPVLLLTLLHPGQELLQPYGMVLLTLQLNLPPFILSSSFCFLTLHLSGLVTYTIRWLH